MTAVAGRLHAAPGQGAREHRRSKDLSRTAIGAPTPVLSSDSTVVRTWAGGQNAYHRRVNAENLGPQLGEAGASQQVFDFASGVAVGAAVAPAWQDGGARAQRPKGPVSQERLSPQQWARLEAELTKGPLAHGFAADQRWTLGRIRR